MVCSPRCSQVCLGPFTTAGGSVPTACRKTTGADGLGGHCPYSSDFRVPLDTQVLYFLWRVRFLKAIIGWSPEPCPKQLIIHHQLHLQSWMRSLAGRDKRREERHVDNKYGPSSVGSCPNWAEVRGGGHRIFPKKESQLGLYLRE